MREKLKQEIQAKAQIIRRFVKRNNINRQNKVFKKDAKKFYRELGKKTVTVNETPCVQEVEAFWSNTWEC